MTKIKGVRPKLVKYGEGERAGILVRVQGVNVRMQDQDAGKLYVFTPALARKLASALNYAAHHAERPTLPADLQAFLAEELARRNGE